MLKKYKLLLFFSFIFVLLFFLLPGFSFAVELNVDYPLLTTGANINSQTGIPEYLEYVFDFAMFSGFLTAFLSLVFAGALYLLSPAVPNALAIARDRVSGTISGLLILTTVYLIITTINPSLSIFKTTDLKSIPPPSSEYSRQAGVYLYDKVGCPSLQNNTWDYSFFGTGSSPDLGFYAKQILSGEIVHDFINNIHYIGILFENPKFWGKCQYINPNISCQKLEPFASSISIYQYDYSPKKGGVTFYRKPFFDPKGGSYYVKATDISHIYSNELKKLIFQNVPENEQKCVKWDKKGICVDREAQDLSGENIASIEIDGNYLVLLVYYNRDNPEPESTNNGPWFSCQAFATFSDTNKNGPREIKWENIRNLNSGDLPNWVIIFPIKHKLN